MLHEPIACGFTLLCFEPELRAAKRVCGIADATITGHLAEGKAGKAETQFVSQALEQLAASPELRAKLEHMHGFGAGNDEADFASRGYIQSLQAIGQQMGKRLQERTPPQTAIDFLAYVYGGLLKIKGRSPSELPEPLSQTWRSHAAKAASTRSRQTGARPTAAALIAMIASVGALAPSVNNTHGITPALLGLDVSPACNAHDGMQFGEATTHSRDLLLAALDRPSAFTILQRARSAPTFAFSQATVGSEPITGRQACTAAPLTAPQLATASAKPLPIDSTQFRREAERIAKAAHRCSVPSNASDVTRTATWNTTNRSRTLTYASTQGQATGDLTLSAQQMRDGAQTYRVLGKRAGITSSMASQALSAVTSTEQDKPAAHKEIAPTREEALAMRQRADNIRARINGDTSAYAINVPDEQLDAMIAYASGSRERDVNRKGKGFNSTAWKYWSRYCDSTGTTPMRDDHAANSGTDVNGYEREMLLWVNALPEIYNYMSPRRGWTSPPRPSSAIKHLRTVRAILSKYTTPPPLTLVVERCTEMMHGYLLDNGVDALLPQQKEPFTNAMIMDMLTCVGPTRGSGKRARAWDWSSFEGIAWKAYIHVSAQTGMRNEEMTSAPTIGFTRRDLALANLTWYYNGVRRKYLTESELRSMKIGDYALLTPPPSKCDPFGMRWGAKPIWLAYSPDDWLCSARVLRDLELARLHVTPEERAEVPLFCHENGAPWARSYTANLLRLFVVAIGIPPERVRDYTPHSWRIYLCNALAALDLTDEQIQAALRWASVEALNTYRLTSAETYTAWLRGSMGARFNVVRGATTRRPDGRLLPRTDNDDAARTFINCRMELLEAAHAADDGDE